MEVLEAKEVRGLEDGFSGFKLTTANDSVSILMDSDSTCFEHLSDGVGGSLDWTIGRKISDVEVKKSGESLLFIVKFECGGNIQFAMTTLGAGTCRYKYVRGDVVLEQGML